MKEYFDKNGQVVVVRVENDFRIADFNKTPPLILKTLFRTLNEALTFLNKIYKSEKFDQMNWQKVDTELNHKFLYQENSKKKIKAHLWSGHDTVCRMYTTGGMSNDNQNFSLFNEQFDRNICRICLNKLQEKSVTTIKTIGNPLYRNISNIIVYVWKLENSNYYVGLTSDIEKRSSQHLHGKGSEWSKLHAPVKLLDEIDCNTPIERKAEHVENHFTLKFMMEYGWRNVRGGFWCHTNEKQLHKQLLNDKIYIQACGFNLDEILLEKK